MPRYTIHARTGVRAGRDTLLSTPSLSAYARAYAMIYAGTYAHTLARTYASASAPIPAHTRTRESEGRIATAKESLPCYVIGYAIAKVAKTIHENNI